jgi:hypothetical protein
MRIEDVATNALATRSGTAATHIINFKTTGNCIIERNNSKAEFAWAIIQHFVKVVLSRKMAMFLL